MTVYREHHGIAAFTLRPEGGPKRAVPTGMDSLGAFLARDCDTRVLSPSVGRAVDVARTRWAIVIVTVLAVTGLVAVRLVDRMLAAEWPVVEHLDSYEVLVDPTPVSLTLEPFGHTLEIVVTGETIMRDVTLWRRMTLATWNHVPEPLRSSALDAMLRRYRLVLASPEVWDRMNVTDWDLVPQPVRTIAYRRMIDYWCGFYDVGESYGIAPRRMADVLSAIVMSESWFDHRGVLVNADGTRDIGLGGASAFARERMRELHAVGIVDTAPAEADYFNPWVSTRFVAIWMKLMLDETLGDLDLAVRAYHRGRRQAGDRYGERYLHGVHRRLTRFIENEGSPPAWNHVWWRAHELRSIDWPWLAAPERVIGKSNGRRDSTSTPSRFTAHAGVHT